MPDLPPELTTFVPRPTAGRVFEGRRPARLGDADPGGRLRFDAVARYLQDLSNDDTRDSGLPDDGAWVVRRSVVEVTRPGRFLEKLELETWCGGTGRRWAERRASIRGAKGAAIEAASLWVYVDVQAMLPKKLDPAFMGLYGPAADGRAVGARLVLEPPPAAVEVRPWPVRRADLDVLDHVNNAVYWTALEELIGERPALVEGPHRAAIEFAKALGPGMDVELRSVVDDRSIRAWLCVDGVVYTALWLETLSAP